MLLNLVNIDLTLSLGVHYLYTGGTMSEFSGDDARTLESALALLDADQKSDVAASVSPDSLQKANGILSDMRQKYGETFINDYITGRRRDKATL